MKLGNITIKQCNKVFALLMDTQLQSSLKENELWMLDYVYDSVLLEDLSMHHALMACQSNNWSTEY